MHIRVGTIKAGAELSINYLDLIAVIVWSDRVEQLDVLASTWECDIGAS